MKEYVAHQNSWSINILLQHFIGHGSCFRAEKGKIEGGFTRQNQLCTELVKYTELVK